MKRLFPIFALVLLVAAGCKNPLDGLPERLKKADRIEVEFNGEAWAGTNPVVLTGRPDIDSLSSMVSATKAEALKCGYDGKIKFMQRDSVIFEGEFNLAADCGHIVWVQDGDNAYYKLTPASMAILAKLREANQGSKLDKLGWFKGRWTQVEGPDLVSYEEWVRVSPTLYAGKSWTLYQLDTVFFEQIELKLDWDDIYYIPTVKENAGPVPFKMTKLEGRFVQFENPEHDFPTKITYEAQGDSVLMAVISGAKEGKEVSKAFPLKRVVR